MATAARPEDGAGAARLWRAAGARRRADAYRRGSEVEGAAQIRRGAAPARPRDGRERRPRASSARPRGRRFVGRPGARAEDLSSNMKRETYLRVTHNNSDRGEGPSREASRAWSPSLPHLGRGAPRHLPFGTRTPGET